AESEGHSSWSHTAFDIAASATRSPAVNVTANSPTPIVLALRPTRMMRVSGSTPRRMREAIVPCPGGVYELQGRRALSGLTLDAAALSDSSLRGLRFPCGP